LRIESIAGYSNNVSFSTGLEALEAALDAVFADRALRPLVIDVRIASFIPPNGRGFAGG
jgi:hypothetical protein